MKVTVSRKGHFNAAHRLYVKAWSDKKNNNVFGKCNNPNFHGHNYELIVDVKGSVDEVTGMVIDLKDLKDLIRHEVEDLLDHKNFKSGYFIFRKSSSNGRKYLYFYLGYFKR